MATLSPTAMTSSTTNVYTTGAFWERLWRTSGIQAVVLFIIAYIIYCHLAQIGGSRALSVASSYYQTWWFRSMCVIAFLGALFAACRLRLHRAERQFNLRLEGRLAERTRIARDLHDTLLQSFQSVLLKFHAVSYMLLDRPDAQKKLEDVIDQARQAITEGRDAVQGLRSSTLVNNDLDRAITMLGEELTTHQGGNLCPDFRVQLEGKPRDLAPILQDDIYRIAGEAVRNAFRHAQAARIEVGIRYDQRQLRLRIRDDGKGIDPKVLEGGPRAGHYGLLGMYERVKLIGGKLEVWSKLDSGTGLELTVPASIAYAKATRETASRAGTILAALSRRTRRTSTLFWSRAGGRRAQTASNFINLQVPASKPFPSGANIQESI